MTWGCVNNQIIFNYSFKFLHNKFLHFHQFRMEKGDDGMIRGFVFTVFSLQGIVVISPSCLVMKASENWCMCKPLNSVSPSLFIFLSLSKTTGFRWASSHASHHLALWDSENLCFTCSADQQTHNFPFWKTNEKWSGCLYIELDAFWMIALAFNKSIF